MSRSHIIVARHPDVIPVKESYGNIHMLSVMPYLSHPNVIMNSGSTTRILFVGDPTGYKVALPSCNPEVYSGLQETVIDTTTSTGYNVSAVTDWLSRHVHGSDVSVVIIDTSRKESQPVLAVVREYTS